MLLLGINKTNSQIRMPLGQCALGAGERAVDLTFRLRTSRLALALAFHMYLITVSYM